MADGSGKCLQRGVNNKVQSRLIEHQKTVTKQGQQSSVQRWTSSAKHEKRGHTVKHTVPRTERVVEKHTVSRTEWVVEKHTVRLVEHHSKHYWSKTEKSKSVHIEDNTKQDVRIVNYHKSYKSSTTCCSTKNKH